MVSTFGRLSIGINGQSITREEMPVALSFSLMDSSERSGSRQVTVATIIISLLLYLIPVPLLFKPFGGAVVGFLVIPVMVVGWHAGMMGGFIVGCAGGLFVNSFMLAYLYNEWVWDVLLRHQGIPGVIMLTLLGGGAGYFRELRDRYLREIRQRIVAQKELEESGRGFQTLFDRSSEGLYLVDPESGSYIEVNPALCSITGYDREELLRVPHGWLATTTDREELKRQMQSLKRGETLDNLEGKIIRKDGGERFIIFGATPIFWKGRKVLYGFMRDITSRKLMQLELERKNREIIDLTNTISHDLRNPLTGIKGILELHCDEAKEKNDEKEQAIDALALKEVDYMQDLLDDLLEAARLDTSGRSFEWKLVALDDLFGRVVELLSLQLSQKKVTVTCDVNGVSVRADERALEKACMNLVGNAIIYMGAQPDPVISIKCRDDGGLVTVSVTDNGMGIPPESLPGIFEKFRRGSNVGSVKGTGLGLSIVKRIVEAHGGTISVESTMGVGSTFVFTIPRRKNQDSGSEAGADTR
jgi:PAS domain S-box-containing protein